MSRYTLEYAQKMLDLWNECEAELASGQAKHYRIGTREFTALDMKEIQLMQKKWEDEVEMLKAGRTGKQARLVVFRDL